ncbi:MAG: ABC transporter substrate-binding protein [Methanothrix sp.]|jgi:iron complex transport system substrate-binding protein|nr:ABC transporter substrate-binding protein [Methanothrix sp.]
MKRIGCLLALSILLSILSLGLPAVASSYDDDSYPRTIVDSLGREITIEEPIERIISLGNYRTEAVKVLGATDKLVGIDQPSYEATNYYSDLSNLPVVGTYSEPDYEMIAELDPDIVITSAHSGRVSQMEEMLSHFDIIIIGLDFYRDELIKSEVETLGYILNEEERAKEYIEWRAGYEDIIADFVESLDENSMPTVYIERGDEAGSTCGNGSWGQFLVDHAGGRNVARELPEYVTVDMEWIVMENPQIIVKTISLPDRGRWGWNDTEEPDLIVGELKNRPGWEKVAAVEDGRVYLYCSEIAWGLDSIVLQAYSAKWFHPDININPEEIYREYLDRFMGVEYPDDLIFVYPPLEA